MLCDQRLKSSFPSCSRGLSGLSGPSQQNEAFACGDGQTESYSADPVVYKLTSC